MKEQSPIREILAQLETLYEILAQLETLYPDAPLELAYKNPFELLIAVILSAQCTDERVNQVTRTLFEHYPTPAALAAAPLESVEEIIRPTGFYRNKAKAVKGCAERLVLDHAGDVPKTMEALVGFPAWVAKRRPWSSATPTAFRKGSPSTRTCCASPSAWASPRTRRPKPWKAGS